MPIYMDHHATTPLDPDILDLITPYYLGEYSEQEEKDALERSRVQIARLIGAKPEEIVFTTGATEADNLGVRGVAYANRDHGDHIITSLVEHKAVLDSCARLEREGFRITRLPVDACGMVDPEHVKKAVTDRTILISIIHGHNEIGVINPIREIGYIAADRNIRLHTDAVQTVGKIPVDVDDLGVDLLSISAHKIYGPKGVGALYIRRRNPPVRMKTLLFKDYTGFIPGAVGLGAACALREKVMEAEGVRLSGLRDRLWRGLLAQVDDILLNGHPTKRLPGNLNVCFEYIEGGSLLLSLRDIAVSSGSACTSRTTIDPSYVLMAMGRSETLAQSAIRFGLGRGNTEEEVDYTVATITREARRLRGLSTHYSLRSAPEKGAP